MGLQLGTGGLLAGDRCASSWGQVGWGWFLWSFSSFEEKLPSSLRISQERLKPLVSRWGIRCQEESTRRGRGGGGVGGWQREGRTKSVPGPPRSHRPLDNSLSLHLTNDGHTLKNSEIYETKIAFGSMTRKGICNLRLDLRGFNLCSGAGPGWGGDH